MAPILSYANVFLLPFTAMKVYLVARVFIHSVAACIATLCMTGEKLDDDAIYIAQFFWRNLIMCLTALIAPIYKMFIGYDF